MTLKIMNMAIMNKNSKVFLAGHNGLVGSAILRLLNKHGYSNILLKERSELDLTSQSQVEDFFDTEKPEYVILAAAKVGGIYANNTFPAEFIYENIMIEANVIHFSYKYNVNRLLFLGSTCIYPKMSNQPMHEEELLTGTLEPTNEPYAISKITGIKLCESYNRQYMTDFRSIMPTNLYGINDNFYSKDSHVIPALIARFHEAKLNKSDEVVIWGTGSVSREFMFVDDMAEASFFVLTMDKNEYLLNTQQQISHINIGTGKDITISELATIIKDVVGFKGKLVFDKSMPDGAPKKLTSVERINGMGWKSKTNLRDGLNLTYSWFLKNYKNHQ